MTISQASMVGRPAGSLSHAQSVVFIVTPGFSSLELSAMAEGFTLAGTVSPECRFDMRCMSWQGGVVSSSSGLSVASTALPECVRARDDMIRSADLIVICSGREVTSDDRSAVVGIVRSATRHNTRVCAMGGIIRCLAESNLVSKGTDHWDRLLPLRETFPTKDFVDAIVCSDGTVLTCAGQAAAIDFMLFWIAKSIGEDCAQHVGNLLLVAYRRSPDQRQPCDARSRYHGLPAHLTRVVQLMYDNIEEPISLQQIATQSGVSGRQLERLSKRFLGCSPSVLYQKIRLDRALRLLRQTDLSVVQISIICGFNSLSAFNKNFKRLFGRSPLQERAGFRSKFPKI